MVSKLIAVLIIVILISISMISYAGQSFAQSASPPQTTLQMKKLTDLITKDDLANKEWVVVKGGKIPIGEMYVPLMGNAYYNNWTFYNNQKILTSAKDICNFVDNNKHVLGTNGNAVFVLGQDNNTNFNGKMWINLSYDDTNHNPRKEFICITASSQADPTGIQLVMEEGQPNKHHFTNIGVLRYGNVVSSDHDYGPLLKINPTDVIHFSLNYNGKTYIADRTVQIPNTVVLGGEGSNGATFPPSLIQSPDLVNCGSSGDVDNDGICDAWESGGPLSVTLNGANYIGPACGGIGQDVCPTPTKKDVFVMADEMNGYALNPGVISDLQTAFKGGPASPPLINGRSTTVYPAVQLHIQEFQNGLDPTSSPFVNGINFPGSTGAANDFNVIKSQDILRPDTGFSGPSPEKAKMAVFHYALLANMIIGDPSSSGVGEQFGNDIVVSLGDPSFGSTPSVTEQEGTLMHELGHNFNLNHGGNTDSNCIPNYLSVMNYLYQFPLLVSTRPLDYSQSIIGDTSGHTYIDDTNLGLATGSSHGVGASTPSNLVVVYATPGVSPFFDTVTAGSEVREWNIQTPFSSMINGFTQTTPPIPSCTGTPGKLWGFKDWDKTTSSSLKFAFSGGKTGQPSANYGLNSADVKAMWGLRLNQIRDTVPTYYQNSTYYKNSIYYKNSESDPLTILNSDLTQNDTNAFIKDLNTLNNAIGADVALSTINKTNAQKTINDVSNAFKLTYGYTKVSFGNLTYVPIDSAVTLSVQDPDVDAKVNSVKVHLMSDNDTAGIDLTLNRDKSGTFVGTVTLTSGTSVDNSKLHVGIGNSVRATYNSLFTTTAQITTKIPPPPPLSQQFTVNPQDFGINTMLQ